MATNTGRYRHKTLTITKKVNDVEVNNSEFPKTHSITAAFGSFPALTDEQFALMEDAEYYARRNAFYDYLEGLYPFFRARGISNPSDAVDTVSCPI